MCNMVTIWRQKNPILTIKYIIPVQEGRDIKIPHAEGCIVVHHWLTVSIHLLKVCYHSR